MPAAKCALLACLPHPGLCLWPHISAWPEHAASPALPSLAPQSVRLGKGYDRLWVDLSASPHERHPSSAKCTMPSPHAHRHLRHVTGLAASSAYQQNVAAAAAGDAAAAEAAAAACEGRADHAAGAAAAEGLTAAAAYARQPTGGRVRIQVEAAGIVSGTVPPPGTTPAPGARVPALDIRIRGQDLHAPILERLIELPMDIDAGRVRGWGSGKAGQPHCVQVVQILHSSAADSAFIGCVNSPAAAGWLHEGALCSSLPAPSAPTYLQVDGELRIYSHDADSWHFPEFYGRVNVR